MPNRPPAQPGRIGRAQLAVATAYTGLAWPAIPPGWHGRPGCPGSSSPKTFWTEGALEAAYRPMSGSTRWWGYARVRTPGAMEMTLMVPASFNTPGCQQRADAGSLPLQASHYLRPPGDSFPSSNFAGVPVNPRETREDKHRQAGTYLRPLNCSLGMKQFQAEPATMPGPTAGTWLRLSLDGRAGPTP
jgi:hypothetical protein